MLVALLFTVFVFQGYPGTEVHLVGVATGAAVDHLELFQAFLAHAAVDFPQHLLAIGVFGIFRAVALEAASPALTACAGDLRAAHMPQLMQLGTWARLALGGDQGGAPAGRGGR